MKNTNRYQLNAEYSARRANLAEVLRSKSVAAGPHETTRTSARKARQANKREERSARFGGNYDA